MLLNSPYVVTSAIYNHKTTQFFKKPEPHFVQQTFITFTTMIDYSSSNIKGFSLKTNDLNKESMMTATYLSITVLRTSIILFITFC